MPYFHFCLPKFDKMADGLALRMADRFQNNMSYSQTKDRFRSVCSIDDTIDFLKSAARHRVSKVDFFCQLRRTLLCILSGNWGASTRKQELLNSFSSYCHHVHSYSRVIQNLTEIFDIVNSLTIEPWQNTNFIWTNLFKKVLTFESKEVQKYLLREPEEIVLARVHALLIKNHPEEAFILAKTSFLYHTRISKKIQVHHSNLSDYDKVVKNSSLQGIASLDWLLFILRKRKSLADIVNEVKELTCHEGILLVQRLKRNIKNRNFAFSLLQIFLIEDLTEASRYCCTKKLFTLWCSFAKHIYRDSRQSCLQGSNIEQNKESDQKHLMSKIAKNISQMLANLAPTSAHFYLIGDVIWDQFGKASASLLLELYVRGLSIDINFLEAAKNCDVCLEVKSMETHIANIFEKLYSFFSDYHEITARECMFSAFSLHPTKERLYVLQSLTHDILSNSAYNSRKSSFKHVNNSCTEAREHAFTFHPFLSSQLGKVMNIKFIFIQDFATLLESVRCNKFQYNVFDWKNNVTDLGDYLKFHTKDGNWRWNSETEIPNNFNCRNEVKIDVPVFKTNVSHIDNETLYSATKRKSISDSEFPMLIGANVEIRNSDNVNKKLKINQTQSPICQMTSQVCTRPELIENTQINPSSVPCNKSSVLPESKYFQNSAVHLGSDNPSRIYTPVSTALEHSIPSSIVKNNPMAESNSEFKKQSFDYVSKSNVKYQTAYSFENPINSISKSNVKYQTAYSFENPSNSISPVFDRNRQTVVVSPSHHSKQVISSEGISPHSHRNQFVSKTFTSVDSSFDVPINRHEEMYLKLETNKNLQKYETEALNLSSNKSSAKSNNFNASDSFSITNSPSASSVYNSISTIQTSTSRLSSLLQAPQTRSNIEQSYTKHHEKVPKDSSCGLKSKHLFYQKPSVSPQNALPYSNYCGSSVIKHTMQHVRNESSRLPSLTDVTVNSSVVQHTHTYSAAQFNVTTPKIKAFDPTDIKRIVNQSSSSPHSSCSSLPPKYIAKHVSPEFSNRFITNSAVSSSVNYSSPLSSDTAQKNHELYYQRKCETSSTLSENVCNISTRPPVITKVQERVSAISTNQQIMNTVSASRPQFSLSYPKSANSDTFRQVHTMDGHVHISQGSSSASHQHTDTVISPNYRPYMSSQVHSDYSSVRPISSSSVSLSRSVPLNSYGESTKDPQNHYVHNTENVSYSSTNMTNLNTRIAREKVNYEQISHHHLPQNNSQPDHGSGHATPFLSSNQPSYSSSTDISNKNSSSACCSPYERNPCQNCSEITPPGEAVNYRKQKHQTLGDTSGRKGADFESCLPASDFTSATINYFMNENLVTCEFCSFVCHASQLRMHISDFHPQSLAENYYQNSFSSPKKQVDSTNCVLEETSINTYSNASEANMFSENETDENAFKLYLDIMNSQNEIEKIVQDMTSDPNEQFENSLLVVPSINESESGFSDSPNIMPYMMDSNNAFNNQNDIFHNSNTEVSFANQSHNSEQNSFNVNFTEDRVPNTLSQNYFNDANKLHSLNSSSVSNPSSEQNIDVTQNTVQKTDVIDKHVKGMKLFSCPKCKKRLISQTSVNRHILKCHPEGPAEVQQTATHPDVKFSDVSESENVVPSSADMVNHSADSFPFLNVKSDVKDEKEIPTSKRKGRVSRSKTNRCVKSATSVCEYCNKRLTSVYIKRHILTMHLDVTPKKENFEIKYDSSNMKNHFQEEEKCSSQSFSPDQSIDSNTPHSISYTERVMKTEVKNESINIDDLHTSYSNSSPIQKSVPNRQQTNAVLKRLILEGKSSKMTLNNAVESNDSNSGEVSDISKKNTALASKVCECLFCHKKYSTATYLKKHVKALHNDSSVQNKSEGIQEATTKCITSSQTPKNSFLVQNCKSKLPGSLKSPNIITLSSNHSENVIYNKLNTESASLSEQNDASAFLDKSIQNMSNEITKSLHNSKLFNMESYKKVFIDRAISLCTDLTTSDTGLDTKNDNECKQEVSKENIEMITSKNIETKSSVDVLLNNDLSDTKKSDINYSLKGILQNNLNAFSGSTKSLIPLKEFAHFPVSQNDAPLSDAISVTKNPYECNQETIKENFKMVACNKSSVDVLMNDDTEEAGVIGSPKDAQQSNSSASGQEELSIPLKEFVPCPLLQSDIPVLDTKNDEYEQNVIEENIEMVITETKPSVDVLKNTIGDNKGAGENDNLEGAEQNNSNVSSKHTKLLISLKEYVRSSVSQNDAPLSYSVLDIKNGDESKQEVVKENIEMLASKSTKTKSYVDITINNVIGDTMKAGINDHLKDAEQNNLNISSRSAQLIPLKEHLHCPVFRNDALLSNTDLGTNNECNQEGIEILTSNSKNSVSSVDVAINHVFGDTKEAGSLEDVQLDNLNVSSDSTKLLIKECMHYPASQNNTVYSNDANSNSLHENDKVENANEPFKNGNSDNFDLNNKHIEKEGNQTVPLVEFSEKPTTDENIVHKLKAISSISSAENDCDKTPLHILSNTSSNSLSVCNAESDLKLDENKFVNSLCNHDIGSNAEHSLRYNQTKHSEVNTSNTIVQMSCSTKDVCLTVDGTDFPEISGPQLNLSETSNRIHNKLLKFEDVTSKLEEDEMCRFCSQKFDSTGQLSLHLNCVHNVPILEDPYSLSVSKSIGVACSGKLRPPDLHLKNSDSEISPSGNEHSQTLNQEAESFVKLENDNSISQKCESQNSGVVPVETEKLHKISQNHSVNKYLHQFRSKRTRFKRKRLKRRKTVLKCPSKLHNSISGKESSQTENNSNESNVIYAPMDQNMFDSNCTKLSRFSFKKGTILSVSKVNGSETTLKIKKQKFPSRKSFSGKDIILPQTSNGNGALHNLVECEQHPVQENSCSLISTIEKSSAFKVTFETKEEIVEFLEKHKQPIVKLTRLNETLKDGVSYLPHMDLEKYSNHSSTCIKQLKQPVIKLERLSASYNSLESEAVSQHEQTGEESDDDCVILDDSETLLCDTKKYAMSKSNSRFRKISMEGRRNSSVELSKVNLLLSTNNAAFVIIEDVHKNSKGYSSVDRDCYTNNPTKKCFVLLEKLPQQDI